MFAHGAKKISEACNSMMANQFSGLKKPLPIYVVSLISDVARRADISEQLAGYPGAWSFIDAVVPGETQGVDWETETSGTSAVSVLGRRLSKGELGCAFSHLGVWKKMVMAGCEAAIVLEDDALVSAAMAELCQEMLATQKFEVLLLGYSKVSPKDGCVRNITEPIQVQTCSFGHEIGRAYRERRSGTVGYLVTLQGAKKLIEIQTAVMSVADDWPHFRRKGLRILHVRPGLVNENLYSHTSGLAIGRAKVEGTWRTGFNGMRQFARIVRGLIWVVLMRIRQASN
jgi:glycosyl transferase family 25